MIRLVTFSCKNNSSLRVGALLGETSLNLNAAGAKALIDLTQYTAEKLGPVYQAPPQTFVQNVEEASRDMTSFIEAGEETTAWLHRVIEMVSCSSSSTVDYLKHAGVLLSMVDDQIQLAAPIPVPRRNIMCVGMNYRDHVKELSHTDLVSSSSQPTYAQFFTKLPSTVIGPGKSIERHAKHTSLLDYEAELAIVIGKKGRDISHEDAMSYVYGYTIANDVTARDIQRNHGQWFRGKSLDTTCPMGPYLLHHSSSCFARKPVHSATDLSIKLWVNNEKRQDSRTSNMILDIPELIHQLSQGLTLQPGDIILTGTPHGIGYAMKPPLSLEPGDHCTIEIEHLGRLENQVIA